MFVSIMQIKIANLIHLTSCFLFTIQGFVRFVLNNAISQRRIFSKQIRFFQQRALQITLLIIYLVLSNTETVLTLHEFFKNHGMLSTEKITIFYKDLISKIKDFPITKSMAETQFENIFFSLIASYERERERVLKCFKDISSPLKNLWEYLNFNYRRCDSSIFTDLIKFLKSIFF